MKKDEDNTGLWLLIIIPIALILMLYKCVRETPEERHEREEFEEVTPRP
jgi:hypothetical protein